VLTDQTAPTRRAPLARRGRSLLARVLLAFGATALTVLVIEVVGRVARVDFDFKSRTFQQLPPFYRIPVVPLGPFFRRPGPERWHGKVVETFLLSAGGGADDPYQNEPAITVEYDRDGFRNPESLRDWVIVVAGDSFTELGHLPYEDLFTTRLALDLKVPVKNLGVSYTGTLAQTLYLRTYGKAPSTREAILVFFEGNDVADLVRERELAIRWANAQSRPIPATSLIEALPPQSSFVVAGYRFFANLRARDAKPEDYADAYFVTGTRRVPVTIGPPPPDRDELSASATALDEAIGGWADTARELGLHPWLAYMPTKRRVLDGHVVPLASQAAPVPVADDLPALVRDAAGAHDVRLIDLTPALRRETEAGRLTYNTVFDTHLNRLGARVVARTLAEQLRPALAGRAIPDH